MDGVANTASASLTAVAYGVNGSGEALATASSTTSSVIRTSPSATGSAEASLIGAYGYYVAHVVDATGVALGTSATGSASASFVALDAQSSSVAGEVFHVSVMTRAAVNASASALGTSAQGSSDILHLVTSAYGSGGGGLIEDHVLTGIYSVTEANGSAVANTALFRTSSIRLAPRAYGDNITASNYVPGSVRLIETSPAGVEYTVPTDQAGIHLATARVLYTPQFFVTLDSTVSVLTGNRGYALVSDIRVGDTLATTVSRAAPFVFRPLGSSSASFNLTETQVNYRVEEIETALNVGRVVVNGVVLGTSNQAMDSTQYNLVAMQADFLGGSVEDVLDFNGDAPGLGSAPVGLNSLPNNTTINGLPVVGYNESSGFLNADGVPIDIGSGGSGSTLLGEKGDLLTHDGNIPVVLPIGSDGQTLQITSGTSTSLEWVTSQIERRVFYGDATPWPLGVAPANRVIKSISLIVLTAFNDLNATLSIGTLSSPELLMAQTDSYPQQAGSYEVSPSMDFDSPTALYLHINPQSSITGEVQLIIDLQDRA